MDPFKFLKRSPDEITEQEMVSMINRSEIIESPLQTQYPLRPNTNSTTSHSQGLDDNNPADIIEAQRFLNHTPRMEVPILMDELVDNSWSFCCHLFTGVLVGTMTGLLILCLLRYGDIKFWYVPIWKWAVLAWLMLCGRVLLGWSFAGVLLTWFHRRRRWARYFFYASRSSILNVIWLGSVGIGWHMLLTNRTNLEYDIPPSIVTKLLTSAILGSLVWLLKDVIINTIDTNYVVGRYVEEMENSLIKESLMQQLGYTVSDDGTPVLRREDVKGSNIEVLWKMVRRDLFISETESQSKGEEMSAKLIGVNVVDTGLIFKEDLVRVTGDYKASMVLGMKEDKGLSKRDFIHWVVNTFKERRALIHTIDDLRLILKWIRNVVSIVAVVFVIDVGLLVFKIKTFKVFIIVVLQLFLFFISGGIKLSSLWDSLNLVLFKHPFRVGDLCDFIDTEGVVNKLSVQQTEILKLDNGLAMLDNYSLPLNQIVNYRTSPDVDDEVNFYVSVFATDENIAIMKQRISEYIEGHGNYWKNNPDIVAGEEVFDHHIKFTVWLRHTMNFQDLNERHRRRGALIEAIAGIVRDLAITSTEVPVGVHEVHVQV